MRWRWWRSKNGHAAAAQKRQEQKLKDLRAKRPEVREEIDRFTAAVERALRGSS